MPVLRSETAETLKEFMGIVEGVMGASPILWYRGVGRPDYKLVPALYRHPTITDAETLIKNEASMLQRFKQRSVPYLVRQLVENWDYLFLMQHSGVPTRLLDWSENPFVALYFAVASTKWKFEGDLQAFESDCCVWVLNPVVWNQKVLSHVTYTGGVLSVSDNQLNGYASGDNLNAMKRDPIALFGTHNSPRIVSQRGVFSIFGTDPLPMEEVYLRDDFPDDTLVKITFPKAKLSDIYKASFALGFTDSLIFPDLDGLALEISRADGYQVSK